MSSKILVIVSTGDREKALTAIMYTRNTIKFGWLDDVKVIFFGPAQNLLVEDDEVAAEADALTEITEPVACKFLSDRDGTSEQTAGLGIVVDYVGTIIANHIKDGYVPMVW